MRSVTERSNGYVPTGKAIVHRAKGHLAHPRSRNLNACVPRRPIAVRFPRAVTVDYAATAGTAVAGTDFTPVSGTLSFPGCSGTILAHDACVEQTFTVPLIDDNVVDGPKTVNLKLSNAMAGTSRAILGYPS